MKKENKSSDRRSLKFIVLVCTCAILAIICIVEAVLIVYPMPYARKAAIGASASDSERYSEQELQKAVRIVKSEFRKKRESGDLLVFVEYLEYELVDKYCQKEMSERIPDEILTGNEYMIFEVQYYSIPFGAINQYIVLYYHNNSWKHYETYGRGIN